MVIVVVVADDVDDDDDESSSANGSFTLTLSFDAPGAFEVVEDAGLAAGDDEFGAPDWVVVDDGGGGGIWPIGGPYGCPYWSVY